ncbi:MAG: hypothetical protein EPO02_12865 [Nitrospirae bacterium]|nr:MAG: hypothetical protein EPO02_12865 [Nitrospirota bacterium]
MPIVVTDVVETHEQRAARYERAICAFADQRFADRGGYADFAEWVQQTAKDLLNGCEAECPICGTYLHDGACVEGSEE